jgi:hypothetical protein
MGGVKSRALPSYAALFKSATRLETISGVVGDGLTDCTAAFSNLSAGYYISDQYRVYRLDGQWVAKSGVHVWGRGSRIVSYYDPVSNSSAAVSGTNITAFGLYGFRIEKPDLTYRGRVLGVFGDQITYKDLDLDTFDSGGIAYNGDDIVMDNLALYSRKTATGNFGIRCFGGARHSLTRIKGETGDDLIALATGPNSPTPGAGGMDISDVTISGVRGRSHNARLIAADLIDQDAVGGMTASIRSVSASNIQGIAETIAITIRNLDSEEPAEIDGISLADIDITLTAPGAAGQVSTRPVSIIGGQGYVRNVTTSNVIIRNTINQSVAPNGLTENIDTSGVTCP